MKIQLNGRFLKKGVLLINLLMNGAIVFAQITSTGGDFRIGAASIKVSKNTEVALNKSLYVSHDALFYNEGSVTFNNIMKETLDINTLLGGSGTYYIKGQNDYILKGNGAAISSLALEGGNSLWLDNDLSIVNSLSLVDGVIEVPEGVNLKIQSAEADAVLFNNNPDNTSFIRRTLIRNTLPGVEYVFPIGTETNGFHPFTISEISSSGDIGVTYEPDFYTTWSVSGNSYQLETVGGWNVATSERNLSFIPGISLFDNSNGVLKDNHIIFYSSDPNVSTPGFTLDYNSWIQEAVLTTSRGYLEGTFALAKITSSIIGDEAVPVPELVNFIVKDGTGRKTFEIPGVLNYKKVSLSVYSRFGNLVYQSSDYANDFDSQNYRSGTYFYELILETNDNKRATVRNIIEILEQN